MKTAIAAIALSLGMFAVTPAFAWHLIPESTDFTGKGKTSATLSGETLPCTANLAGNTDSSGLGYITSGSFTGSGGICNSVTLDNLPWPAKAISGTKVTISGVQFSSSIGLDCGPGNLTVLLTKAGHFYWKNQPIGECTLSGNITTTPQLHIAKH